MAAELHCNLVAMSPLELQMRAFFTIFIVNQFPEALIHAGWFCLACTKTQLFTDFHKKLHLAFCNIKKYISLLHLCEAMGSAFSTALNQSSSEAVLGYPTSETLLKGFNLFSFPLLPWIIQLLIPLSLLFVLRDLTIILHNLSVCKEGVGISFSIPQSLRLFFPLSICTRMRNYSEYTYFRFITKQTVFTALKTCITVLVQSGL